MTILTWFFPVIVFLILANILAYHFYVAKNEADRERRQKKFRKVVFWQFIIIALVFGEEYIRLYEF